jgi:hypothetical protein
VWTAVASLLLAFLGLVATRTAVANLAAGAPAREPHVYWLLGVVGLVPAWLVPFIALMGAVPTPRIYLSWAIPWALSSSAALIGAIVSEAAIRRGLGSDPPRAPARCWWLGALGFAPAWVIALLGDLLA